VIKSFSMPRNPVRLTCEPLETRVNPTSVSLLKDIRTGTESGEVEILSQVGDVLLLKASTRDMGSELWGSNVVTGVTSLIRDIAPQNNGSNIFPGVELNGIYYFTAEAPQRKLWRTDGTTAGTYQVVNIQSNFPDFGIEMIRIGNEIFLIGTRSSTYGSEVWKSDGTAAGTVRLTNVMTAPFNAFKTVSKLINSSGELYFTTSINHTPALWKWDSATQTSIQLAEFSQSIDTGRHPSRFVTHGGQLYFAAWNTDTGTELWTTDGTPMGTRLVKDINPGPDSGTYSILSANGVLYLGANHPSYGSELWKSDGTEAGTVLIKDIRPGTNSSFTSLLGDFQGKLYFSAASSSTEELWTSDGTTNGTIKFVISTFTSNPSYFSVHGNRAYFSMNSGSFGFELWTTDGTSPGTRMVKDINPGPTDSSNHPMPRWSVGDTIYFTAISDISGRELWKTDSTAAGTAQVADINTFSMGSGITYSANPVSFGNSTIFAATDLSGTELWISDGTPSGTKLLKDINAGSLGSNPFNFYEFQNQLYFDIMHGSPRWWVTNGTTVGTRRTLNASSQYYSQSGMDFQATLQNRLISFSTIPSGGFGLHSSTAAIPEPQLLTPAEIYNPLMSNRPSYAATTSKYYWANSTPGTGFELWASDGTPGGTGLVKDIVPGTNGSSPFFFRGIGDTLYFFAKDEGGQYGLWKSDGTESGTVLLRHFDFSTTELLRDRYENFHMEYDGDLYFALQYGADTGLWKFDTQLQQLTKLSSTLYPTRNALFDETWKIYDNKLYFIGGTTPAGSQLIVTDGTPEGTQSILNVATAPTQGIAMITELEVYDGYLIALSPSSDIGKFWRSDGTPAGTVPVPELQNGIVFSRITPMNGYAFALGDDLQYGFEPRRIEFDPASVALSSASIAENSPNNAVVGNLSFNRPGSTTYQLISSSVPAFAIVDGQLICTNGSLLNYESATTQSVTIRAVNFLSGKTVEQTIPIQILNANDAPTNLILSNSTVTEHSPVGTSVGTLIGSDPDNQPLTYSFIVANPRVGINGNQLVVADSVLLNFETGNKFPITVRVSDGFGGTFDKSFQITILNANDPPKNLAVSGDGTVPEHAPAGFEIGAFSALDEDGDPIAWSLASPLPGVVLSGNRLLVQDSAWLDFETRSGFSVTVNANDNRGGSTSQVFDFTILNRDEPRIVSMIVDAGTIQRSVVRSITLQFNSVVTIAAGAFQLRRNNILVTTKITPTQTIVDGVSVVKLKFSGVGTQYASLIDGRYTLTILGSKVTDSASGLALDGNNDFQPGGDDTRAFHRLFGDANGDQRTNLMDLSGFYAAENASRRGQAFNRAYDINNDGRMTILDRIQFFRRYRRV
jgi:ELWxxDGT repeat protein